MSRKIFGSILIALALARAVLATSAGQREQLPADVVPLHYDLRLVPDADTLRFRGQVRITIDVKKSTSVIQLNAVDLTFDHAVIDQADRPASVKFDENLQRAVLTFGNSVEPARHILTIDYHGAIGTGTVGFFAMDYVSPAGKRRTLATNFEPASERRFMPSWDEPGLKATFTVTVDAPVDRMAVSNMPIASTETLQNGHKRVRFAETPKMSTYLLFLAIGDFERMQTDVEGTDVGVVVNRGDTPKGHYALNEAVRCLRYYNDYFGIRYPLPKLDLVAAPGAITGGAMENWGAIFYSQDSLLFDPKLSTAADRQAVFMTVSHEMAHQWFGDLVTMAWWDDLWLNEGFARWMQTKIADDLHPEWKTGLQAQAVAESGKREDAKPATHPIVQQVLTASQAEEAFDNITYDKGASVINMLEAYVGPTQFRDGVRRYMRAHAYANTVDIDFWREVQAVAGKPILQIESDFTRQPGLPLLKVESERTNNNQIAVLLTQQRFFEDPSRAAFTNQQLWHIPVALSAGEAITTQLLSGSGTSTLEPRGTGPVIVNAGQTAFVRTLYSQPILTRLIAKLPTEESANQLGLFYDNWALGQSGYEPVTCYLDLTRALPITADPIVWQQVIRTLTAIDRLYAKEPGQNAFRRFARDRLNPLASRLGWEPSSGEEENAAVLREAVLEALSRFGDQSTIEEARRRFALFLQQPNQTSPAMRRIVLSIMARHADSQTLDRLIQLLRATNDPLEKELIWSSLLGVADRGGAQRVLDLALGPDVPAGTQPYVPMAVSRDHPDLAWKFATEHVDRPGFTVDSQIRLFMMPAIAGSSNELGRAQELEQYAHEHIPSSAHRFVEEAVETIKLNSKFREQQLSEIDRWLANPTAR